ncbi:MAG: hypothetical protein NTV69_09675, partial [Caldilinea sp.]|nr:hypothetical protein [Caldilinea sp.]
MALIASFPFTKMVRILLRSVAEPDRLNNSESRQALRWLSVLAVRAKSPLQWRDLRVRLARPMLPPAIFNQETLT